MDNGNDIMDNSVNNTDIEKACDLLYDKEMDRKDYEELITEQQFNNDVLMQEYNENTDSNFSYTVESQHDDATIINNEVPVVDDNNQQNLCKEDEFDEDYKNWKYIHNDFDVNFITEDPTDKYLLEVLTKEIRYIDDVIKKKTSSASLLEILNIFIDPMVPVIVNAVNASAVSNNETIQQEDAIHFILCIIALHFYTETPTNFFELKDAYLLAKNLNYEKFKKVLDGLNNKRQSNNDSSEILWDQPFMEDPSIREGEEAMFKVNRQFFIQNKSILSADDDHLRLSKKDSEDIGLPRKNNLDKAFGPVSTLYRCCFIMYRHDPSNATSGQRGKRFDNNPDFM
jgi:hypothetical protein